MLISVDLPAPFSPTMPVIVPLPMASDTPPTACTLLNDLSIEETSIAFTSSSLAAAVELALGELGASARIVPGGRRRAGHIGDQLGVRVGVFDALLVAALEAADQRDVHAAHEAHLAGLRRERRRHADQEGALMLLE